MKLILGQGNPGSDYTSTRHNIGFLALDFFARQNRVEFQPKTKFHGDITEVKIGDEKVILVKPTTFYNETGQSARTIADFYKIDPTDILVIHDELALPFGTIRTREKGSDAGNNGVKSLNAHLGEDYARVRVGIHNSLTEKIGAHDFVLGKFNSDENTKLTSDILPKIAEIIDDFISGTHQPTSHKL